MSGLPAGQEALTEKIKQLKEEHDAVILAHNYQLAEIQEMADYSGDSLELARKAAATDASVIVFCGVHFMAESAKILSPDKKVLLPVKEAGCPMADMITAKALQEMKAQHPQAVVVAYVNSSAEVKAESDYCCTSANAVTLVNAIPEEEVLFVPDKNLGSWVARHTDKKIILWDGFCATHDMITVADVEKARKDYPDAELLVHPECRPEICDQADAVLSTSQMIKYVKTSPTAAFIIGTETGLLHPLQQAAPSKKNYPLCKEMICPNMKLTTLQDLANALAQGINEITVGEEIRTKAIKSLEAMIHYG